MANKGKKSFLDYFKINQSNDEFEDDLFDEDEEDDEDDYDFEDDYEPVSVKNSRSSKEQAASVQPNRSASYTQPKQQVYQQPSSSKKTARTSGGFSKNTAKVVPINSTRAERATYNDTPGSDIYSIQPARFDDGQIVVNHLIDNDVVLCNLEGLDQYDAQRIIDFISGACCAIDAGIRKLSEYVYVIAPSGVYLTGDFKDGYDAGRGVDASQYSTATYTDSAFGSGSYY